jgi:iron-sulfur cluster repair protein YtfE (RIC family)
MKRDPSLIPLSHQHHNGLALCVLADRSLAADTSAENVRTLAGRIIDRYEVELVNHFSIEEKVLFPECPDELGELVSRLIAEHRQIERIVDRLRQEPTPADVTEFTRVIRQHIRLEESELFEQAQQLIPRETLDSLGRVIDKEAVRVCL